MNHKTIILIFISIVTSYGQIDKQFWFAAPDISASHGDRPVYLNMATLDQAAKVKVSIPYLNMVLGSFTIATNSLYTLDLTSKIDLIENGDYGFVSPKGILIESDQEITAYYEISGTGTYGASNSDIYALKGSNALGKNFILPMQNFWKSYFGLSDAWASFQIVATENNTHVEITPTQDLYRHPKGQPFSIVLNKGEVFSERASSVEPLLKPTGTVVKSDKNIAITITDDSMFDTTTYVNGGGAGAWDLGGDQIVPSTKAGKAYVVVRASAENLGIDKIFITGIEYQTEVIINDSTILQLDKGETQYYVLDKNYNYISASKPVYVLHIGGFNSEIAAALLPPITCTGSKKVTVGIGNTDGAGLSIVVERGGEADFVFNGNKDFIKASDFTVLTYDTNYLCAKILLPSIPNNQSRIIIENSLKSFQLGLFNRFEGTFTYGFFSDFGTLNLPDTVSICPGTPYELSAGFGKDSYTWYKNGTDLQTPTASIKIEEAGTYKVNTFKGLCQFTDSTKVGIYQVDHTLFDTNAVSFCPNETNSIGTEKTFTNYLWTTGETTPLVNITKAGTYILVATDSNSCPIKDSIIVHIYDTSPLKVNFLSEIDYCEKEGCFPLSINNDYLQYYVNDSLLNGNAACVFKKNSHKYLVNVTDPNGCIQKDSIAYDCTPYIGSIPNIITPKESDGLNDSFFIPKLTNGSWKLTVYNRYGAKVYEDPEYNNLWHATNVAEGIYFYELNHKFRDFSHKGWLEIR